MTTLKLPTTPGSSRLTTPSSRLTTPSSSRSPSYAHPAWRACWVGVYRLWRNAGFAVGALLAGIIADAVSIDAAIYAVAALAALSGVIVMARVHGDRFTRRR